LDIGGSNYQDKTVFLGTNILQNLWETKSQRQVPHMQGTKSTDGTWGMPNTTTFEILELCQMGKWKGLILSTCMVDICKYYKF
jgi:hypothetical protein